jgi:hypothetical protein
MSVRTDRPPVVPLQSAAGPENPPCPACTNPLFPWVAEPWREAEAVLRCEVCGIGVARTGGSPEEARAAAEAALEGGAPNRASFAAWIASGAWAGLEPDRRYLLTPESLERLAPRAAQPPRPALSIALMWQTLQNSFTFGRNLALGRSGRVVATPAGKAWQQRLDWAIVVLTALPLLPVAVLLEVPAALAGRGGALRPR